LDFSKCYAAKVLQHLRVGGGNQRFLILLNHTHPLPDHVNYTDPGLSREHLDIFLNSYNVSLFTKITYFRSRPLMLIL